MATEKIEVACSISTARKTISSTLPDTSSDFSDSLSQKQPGDRIHFRARIHHARAVGASIVFLVFRRHLYTVQGVLTVEEGIVSPQMVRWAETLHTESIVWVEGTIQQPQGGQDVIKSTTVHEIEIKIEKVRPRLTMVDHAIKIAVSCT